MAKKSDYSLFIIFFLQFIKKIGLFIIFQVLIIHYSLFFGSLFTIHYKKGPLFTNHYTPSIPSCLMSEFCSSKWLKLYSMNFAIAHAQLKIVMLIKIGHNCVA